jgi:hypothetical protein
MKTPIGLMTYYSSLYARNRIKYTFVAIHSIFMAAVTMLYVLRASPSLRQDLTKPAVQINILTFLTLFRGISNGRAIGEKCSNIIERLGDSLLTLSNDTPVPDADVDTEFQLRVVFGLIHSPRPPDMTNCPAKIKGNPRICLILESTCLGQIYS